jgi:peptide-methionine (S)-S-oxide reductase
VKSKAIYKNDMESKNNNKGIATLAAGCFWCVEAVFQNLQGVESAVSGYMGGHLLNPSYKDICTGETGHAEVLQITYDESVISFEGLLEVFFKTHNPTTLNRQGNDVGTQYRSSIFYHSDEQKAISDAIINKLTFEGAYDSAIVTLLEPASVFYPAEDYHQNYFNKNGQNPYCEMVVKPKVEKFKKVFAKQLKTTS